MKRTRMVSEGRRKLLRLTFAVFSVGGVSGYLSRAMAAARIPLRPGVREFNGEVFINQQPARVDQLVQPGDVVMTGKSSQVIFVIGRDAFLLRANTRFEVQGQPAHLGADGKLREAVVETLRVVDGAMLAVFGRMNKRIVTPLATLGIRGTGVYVEIEKNRNYVCTCYGRVDIASQQDAAVNETVRTTHHESPRYVTGGETPRIEKAPVRNHSDAELTMLEALVGREPPFDANSGYSY